MSIPPTKAVAELAPDPIGIFGVGHGVINGAVQVDATPNLQAQIDAAVSAASAVATAFSSPGSSRPMASLRLIRTSRSAAASAWAAVPGLPLL